MVKNVVTSEPITRNELDAKLETLASKEDLAEIQTDIKWMKWIIAIAVPVLVAAASVPEIITAIKS